jgi:hypothetical protein
MKEHISVAEYKELCKKEKKNKYKNEKVTIDGITFDSIAEGNRYAELKLLQRQGIIKDLELQPEYLLQDSFTKDGIKHREIKYIADFRYIVVATGELKIEDTKGCKTKEYRLKKKLFEKMYPGLSITEVR